MMKIQSQIQTTSVEFKANYKAHLAEVQDFAARTQETMARPASASNSKKLSAKKNRIFRTLSLWTIFNPFSRIFLYYCR